MCKSVRSLVFTSELLHVLRLNESSVVLIEVLNVIVEVHLFTNLFLIVLSHFGCCQFYGTPISLPKVTFASLIILLSESYDGFRVGIKDICDGSEDNKDDSEHDNLNLGFLSWLPVIEGLLPESILLKLLDFLAPVFLLLGRHL